MDLGGYYLSFNQPCCQEEKHESILRESFPLCPTSLHPLLLSILSLFFWMRRCSNMCQSTLFLPRRAISQIFTHENRVLQNFVQTYNKWFFTRLSVILHSNTNSPHLFCRKSNQLTKSHCWYLKISSEKNVLVMPVTNCTLFLTIALYKQLAQTVDRH